MKQIFIKFIKIYQKVLSPFLGNNCRYYPSCSEYSIQAIEKYGVLKGILKSIWRILRCNPFSKGGVDYP
ncbi:MAG: membrane protein insertion efficiency factor YidD [Hydrogenothermus sp.]|nr:MAG: membrane protein insertion efficiency factor YidD [Hydrogenothermus sp.]